MIKLFEYKNLNRDAVIDLWVDSFGDTREYVEFFLDNCPGYVCIEYLVDDKPISMLFLLEGYLSGSKCKYLYAACTHKDFRSRGIMGQLIEYAKQYCIQLNYSSIFLVPAEEELYSYYKKFGFADVFRKKYLKVKIDFINDPNYSSTDIDIICEVKKSLIKNIECFRFDDEGIRYTVQEHFFNGGRVFLKQTEGRSILAFYYLNNSNLIVKEFLTDYSDISLVFDGYFNNKNAENIYIYIPIVYNSRDIVERYTKCGMCVPLNDITSDFIKDHTDLYAGMYLD